MAVFENKLATIFNLNDKNWLKHANPLSVYTRYTVLPFLLLAIWSRLWIGNWYYLALFVSFLWMFFNPILFRKAKSTKNWASKSVLGERVFLNRDQIPIPKVHRSGIHSVLNSLSAIGMVLAIWGAVDFQLCLAIMGTCLAYIAKSWYLDRMVWLYEDMKNEVSDYQSWDY